jgi:hypothetical protein
MGCICAALPCLKQQLELGAHQGACFLLLQVAKTMAPAVIYIDEVEKVFVSDKKKAKEFGGQVSTWPTARLYYCISPAASCSTQ